MHGPATGMLQGFPLNGKPGETVNAAALVKDVFLKREKTIAANKDACE